MNTIKKSNWMLVAVLCLTLGGTSWGQKKKSSDAEAIALAAKAMEFVRQGALPQAIEGFTKAIEGSPKDFRLYRDRGSVYLTMSKFTEAVADFTKQIELEPKDFSGYSGRGAALSELGQLDPALADLNKAVELQADDPRTLERRGLVFYRQKNYEAALADYNKALEIHAANAPSPTPGTEDVGVAGASPAPAATPGPNPASAMALSRRADAYVMLQQFEPAQADLQAYLKIRPEDFNAEERLRFVNAKLAPPVAAPKATPEPTPPPVNLLTRTNVFIALGVLLLIGVVAVLIAHKIITRSSD